MLASRLEGTEFKACDVRRILNAQLRYSSSSTLYEIAIFEFTRFSVNKR
jgi:hypothetical protein